MINSAAPGAARPHPFPAGLRRLLPARWREPAPLVPVLRLSGVIGPTAPRSSASTWRADRRRARPRLSVEGRQGGGAGDQLAPAARPPSRTRSCGRIRAARRREEAAGSNAFVEDVAASGGYMIACAADEIIADPTSILGRSASSPPPSASSRLIEKIGVERRAPYRRPLQGDARPVPAGECRGRGHGSEALAAGRSMRCSSPW